MQSVILRGKNADIVSYRFSRAWGLPGLSGGSERKSWV